MPGVLRLAQEEAVGEPEEDEVVLGGDAEERSPGSSLNTGSTSSPLTLSRNSSKKTTASKKDVRSSMSAAAEGKAAGPPPALPPKTLTVPLVVTQNLSLVCRLLCQRAGGRRRGG